MLLDDASVVCVLEKLTMFELLLVNVTNKRFYTLSEYVCKKLHLPKQLFFQEYYNLHFKEETSKITFAERSIELLEYLERLSPHKATFISLIEDSELNRMTKVAFTLRHNKQKFSGIEKGDVYIGKTPLSIRIMRYLVSWINLEIPRRWDDTFLEQHSSIYTLRPYPNYSTVSKVDVERFLNCRNTQTFKSAYVVEKTKEFISREFSSENMEAYETNRYREINRRPFRDLRFMYD